MFGYQHSIRNKVRFGYYLTLSLILGVVVLSYLDLSTLNRKITFSVIISEFFDSTLEMRRYEKNYFLYKDEYDYTENLRFTELAENILKKNEEDLKKFSPKTDFSALEANILEYKTLMQRHYMMTSTRTPANLYELEGRIRESGKKLLDVTQDVAVKERKYILSIIKSSQTLLVVAAAVLFVVGLFKIHYLSRMVVRPLKQLEDSMRSIAEGNFDTLPVDYSLDREIISLRNAFNRMMKELEHRQMRLMVQSEKLVSLGTMVSGVAHELNNPLSNVSSSCQILLEEIEEGDMAYKKELLRQIEAEADRAKSTVHSLLEFSRKKEFKRKSLRLKDLAEETVRLLQGDIPTGVELGLDIPEDCWIVADKTRLQQAVLNIIKNGIDAIPGEGAVTITAREDVSEGMVEIRVKDTGTGIEAGNVENIFDPFFTTKEDGKGSGLGLFVTREIIEEHGGKVEVDSAFGQGTTFIIKLPVKERDGLQG